MISKKMENKMDDFFQALKDDHSDFDQGKLETHFGSEPWDMFTQWYKEAFDSEKEANAMSLSTVNRDGQPSSRIVYLKEMLNHEFVFYTNYNSDKGKDMEANNKVGLLFFWPTAQRQLRIEGVVEKVSAELSDEYFASRPRGSQLGAWASNQSDKLAGREELENKLIELDKRFPEIVDRPPHWGGYVVKPTRFEFWQGRPSRLHDRIVFEKTDESWSIFRINP